jgi:peptide/nickel transport system permease protein
MRPFWGRFLRRKSTVVALAILATFVLVAVAAPWLAPQEDPANPTAFKIFGSRFEGMPQPPSAEHPLGTVPRRFEVRLPGIPQQLIEIPQLDIYYTLVWGTRSAFQFGLLVTGLTASFGILVGLVSGYFGGMFNGASMRVTDAFLAFPPIAAVWLFAQIPRVTAFGGRLIFSPIMLALIAFSWMPYARLVNAMVGDLRRADFVTAARALGARDSRILFRHLLPNAITPAIVVAARDIGGLVILESAFVFIGMEGSVAWGTLLVASRDYVIGVSGNPLVFWWTFVPASLALILFGVAWNLLGDALNDALNPYTARR